jgi:anti-sigma B factor antagonist
MDISVESVEEVVLVRLVGDVDGSTAPQAQNQIMPLVQPGSRILLDMSGVSYMSSAGLRMLLSTYLRLPTRVGELL